MLHDTVSAPHPVRPAIAGPGSSLRGRLVGLLLAGGAMLLPAACRNEARIETLDPFAVDLKWDRPGEVRLLVEPTDAGRDGATATLSLEASGVVELQRIARRFEVVPSVERSGAAGTPDSPVELQRLAQRAIRDHYPQLASNAEAQIRTASIAVGDTSIELDGRPTMASVRFAVDPEAVRMEDVSLDRLPARIESVRLVFRERPEELLLEGAVAETPTTTTTTFGFDLSRLGEGRCAVLRSMLRGEAMAMVDALVERRGRSSSVMAAVDSPAFASALRGAAEAELARLAEGGQPADLELRLATDGDAFVHGDPLPAAYVENVSGRPVIAISSMLYQVEHGAGGVIFDEFLQPVDCLCPGERIELPAPTTTTDPCLPESGRGDGIRYLVKSTREREIFGLEHPADGGLPMAARPFGRFEILPVRESGRPTIEAEDLAGRGASDLELRLRRGDGDVLRLPFPDIPAGGRAGITLPDGLGGDAVTIWRRWTEEAVAGDGPTSIELELLESWRTGCDGATPARQRLRLIG